MAYLQISDESIPSLTGKTAIVTGGASGIGFAAANILARHGALVTILDLQPPDSKYFPNSITYRKCDVRNWAELSGSFLAIGHIDMVFANAGISGREVFLEDDLPTDDEGQLLEPEYPLLNVNFRCVLNVVKLSWGIMKKQGKGGSIVITSSATAYAPEVSIPLYCALKVGLIGLVRSLRPVLPSANITINAVAPSATETPLVARRFLDKIEAAGLPISSAETVGLALVYSATARQPRRVQAYGKEKDTDNEQEGRWNGRVIMTLGDRYVELEEPIARLRGEWMGQEVEELVKAQQAETDFRE